MDTGYTTQTPVTVCGELRQTMQQISCEFCAAKSFNLSCFLMFKTFRNTHKVLVLYVHVPFTKDFTKVNVEF